jgi:hypothetical protein
MMGLLRIPIVLGMGKKLNRVIVSDNAERLQSRFAWRRESSVAVKEARSAHIAWTGQYALQGVMSVQPPHREVSWDYSAP